MSEAELDMQKKEIALRRVWPNLGFSAQYGIGSAKSTDDKPGCPPRLFRAWSVLREQKDLDRFSG